MNILEHFDIDIGQDELAASLGYNEKQMLQSLIDTGLPLLNPKAAYGLAFVESAGQDIVRIQDVQCTSKVLSRKLQDVGRVYPYVITIGPELEEAAGQCPDMLQQYGLEILGDLALNKVRERVVEHIKITYGIPKLSFMGPGSLEDWPIEEQTSLFSFLPGVTESIGVELQESMLMVPRKSLSGIFFPTEVSFVTCQLCSRPRCERRKAKYNEELAREYGLI